MSDYYKAGCFNVLCDVCGKKCKSDEVLKRWDGAVVCKADFEHRHPQEFIRPRKERSTPPFTRPEPADVFISVCTVAGVSSIAGYAMAGCSLPTSKYLG